MKLIDNLFKEKFDFKNPIKNMLIDVYHLEPEEFLEKMFDIYKPKFKESDVMNMFNNEKYKFVRDTKNKFIDKLEKYSDKKVSVKDFVEWLEEVVKPYLPYVD